MVTRIDAGRTLFLDIRHVDRLALWVIARRYRVGPILTAFGCLILAGTVCFFITSHSARSDMLVGLSILLLAGWLPLMIEKPNANRDILLGLLVAT